MARDIELNVQADTKLVQDDLNQIFTNIPEAEREQAERIAEIFAREIRKSIRRNFDPFQAPHMQESVFVVPTGSGSSGSRYTVAVDAPIEGGGGDYAAWHEFADAGHWVALTEENSPIMEWAQQKGLSSSAGGNPFQHPAIFVEPQPFMTNPVRTAARKMRNQLRQGGSVGEMLDRVFG